jgi:hypothetical protein
MFGMDTLPFDRILRLVVLLIMISLIVFTYAKAYLNNKKKPSSFFKYLNFCLLTIITLVIILAGFIAATSIDHQDRYLTIGLPLLILLFSIFSIHSLVVSRVMYGAVAMYFTALFLHNYNDPVKQFDYKKVAGYVEQNARPGEPILFYHSTIALPFRYYYKGNHVLAPLPHEVHMDDSYMDNVKDTAELKNAMANIATTSNSYLLISDLNLPKYRYNANRLMVNDYLASHYKITLDTLYFGSSKQRSLRIRRLEKK